MIRFTEEQRQRIVAAAERCEREMGLGSTYIQVGDFKSAARCADLAEVDSNIAFGTAFAASRAA